jgi:hydrogenase expression/formation protein HypC
MCLGIPGKIIARQDNNDLPMARIDYGGVIKEACLVYTPEAKVGDYVIVHVGFALNVLDEKEAMETLDLFRQMDAAAQMEEAEKAQGIGAAPEAL